MAEKRGHTMADKRGYTMADKRGHTMADKRGHTMADKRGHTHCLDIHYMCQESRGIGNRVFEGEYRGEGHAERAGDAAE